MEPVVLVHGGAGDSPDSRDDGAKQGTKLAARLGYDKLLSGGSVIDAVEEAVRSMELDENFNAGTYENIGSTTFGDANTFFDKIGSVIWGCGSKQ